MERMDRVKKHFEEEAAQYDGIIKNLIPYYHKMVEALVNTLPFDPSLEIQVIDLGCGTGTISRAVKDAYPNAKLTCVDISEKMLKVAAGKLSEVSDAIFIKKNFYDFNFDKNYDAVVSSLALHHLETKEDKLEFYRKIYSCLNDGGIFVNADVVLASTEALQQCYMTQWKNFMLRNVPKDEVDSKWIPAYYEEDRPVSMIEHFEMLKDSGFKIMDVVWKYYNFAVYMAIK
ncbi:class I SAM-dependent methyltransferase [Treponema sp. J25]|jgi:tRNA (cmo5U34)-methyltransferase|uniref:class I SAM-dependent methyltransferase n=1 Tax=Treponema sp. J25 TaxID=2094121 RepID=UPI001A9E4BE9|nr:class I SAM-dependent methyltransferase [Treponema sp. J25]